MLSFVLTLALAAPAPPARPRTAPAPVTVRQVAGHWDMAWGRQGPPYDGWIVFRGDGTIEEWWGGQRYTGTWSLEGDWVLVVEEDANGWLTSWSWRAGHDGRGDRHGLRKRP